MPITQKYLIFIPETEEFIYGLNHCGISGYSPGLSLEECQEWINRKSNDYDEVLLIPIFRISKQREKPPKDLLKEIKTNDIKDIGTIKFGTSWGEIGKEVAEMIRNKEAFCVD